MHKVPKLVIDGKEIMPNPPMTRLWREFVEFEKKRVSKELPFDTWLDSMAEMVAKGFSRDDVTTDLILDHVPMQDIVALYSTTYTWVLDQVYGAFTKIPNAEAAES